MKKILEVSMFGTFRMQYGNHSFIIDRKSTTKTNRLLQIILHAGTEGVTREELVGRLWENEEVANPSNSFRAILCRVRKLLKEQGLPESDYIISQKGIYYWTPEIPYRCDCISFEEKAEHALKQAEDFGKTELEEAVRLYRGEFLPALGASEWVIFWATKYRKLYMSCVKRLCGIYRDEQEYQKLYETAEKAAVLYPLDDWQVYQMEALIAMKRSKEAVALYHKTEEMLLAELGSEPSKSMLEQLKRISSCVTEDATHIQAIQEKLEEEGEEGAFYCSYPVFIENYRFAKRVLQRTGKSAWLLMSTITDGKGYASEGGVHFEYIRAELEQALKNSLRSGDLYTRYSTNQYLILLIGIEEENCGLVIERINNNMERTAGKKYVKYHKVLVNGTDE